MHLDSINQNTNDIHSNYECVVELENKIEKLTEKIDEIQMKLDPKFYNKNYSDIKLSPREKDFFMGLYTEEDRISMSNLSRKLGITPEMAEAFVHSLSSKGIPVVRQMVDSEIHVSLEYTFKDLQARKNILQIDTTASLFTN